MRRLFALPAALVAASVAWGQNVSDVAATRHNLSVSGTGTVTASTETQVCVFCHTPHGATNAPGAPLWNRQLSGQTYTTYTSSSLDAETIAGQNPMDRRHFGGRAEFRLRQFRAIRPLPGPTFQVK